MSTPVQQGDDVLVNYGILAATKVTPHISTVRDDELLVGYTTTAEPGVTPGMRVELGIVPDEFTVYSARIMDPERNCKASWVRRNADEQPPEWVTVVSPVCFAKFSSLMLRNAWQRWRVRWWEFARHRYLRRISAKLAA